MKTTKSRLAFYRSQSAKYPSRHGWKDFYHKGLTFASPNNVKTKNGDILTDSLGQYGPYLGDCHKLAPRIVDCTGWYADNFQDSLIIGGVAKMRSSKGTYYIPVTHCTGWDGTTHYVSDMELVPKGSSEDDHETVIKEASRSANHYAEKEAEEAREEDAKQSAEMFIEESRQEIHEINQAVLPLINEIKGQTLSPNICAALRKTLADYLNQRGKAFARMAELEADYWKAVPCC